MRKYQLFLLNVTVALCAAQTCAKLTKERAELLVRHLDVMRELKTTVTDHNQALNEGKQACGCIAATDAHLSFPELKSVVDTQWEEFFVQHCDLVDTILTRERSHALIIMFFIMLSVKNFA